MADAPRLPGAPVGGAYQIASPLGASDGDVYETTHSRMPGRFAMKLLRRAQGAPVEAIDRFRSDVERTAALRHPNVAEVLEIGAMGAEGEEFPLVVMERLEGQTLAERMAGRGRMPLSDVVTLVREVANALEAAHQVGVTHGAVRPDNIFLAEVAGYERGFVKLLDFGVIHLDAAAEGRGAFADLGADTIRYLAPEQARALAEGAALYSSDPRSDQFGLAAVTYRLLSGQDPFAGGDARLVLEAVKAAALRPLDEMSGCDLRVSMVVHRALARDPARRHESVLAFAKAFEEAANSEPLPANEPLLANEPRPVEVTPEVAVHPSLRKLSQQTTPSTPMPALPIEDVPAPRSFVRPNSVTQVFFAEGERKEQGEWTAEDLEEYQDVDPEKAFDSFDKLPRRRSRFLPLVALGLLALGAGAFWLGWRPEFLSINFNPSLRPGPAATPGPGQIEMEAVPAPVATGEPLAAPVPAGPAAVPAVPAAVPSAARAAAPSAPPAAARPAPPVVTADRIRARTNQEAAAARAGAPAAPVAAPAEPPAAPAQMAAPAPTRMAAPVPAAVPAPAAGGVIVVPPEAPAVAQPTAPAVPAAPPVAAPAPITGSPAPAPAAAPPAPEPAPAVRERASDDQPGTRERPLRGYVWSPREGRLVPAE